MRHTDVYVLSPLSVPSLGRLRVYCRYILDWTPSDLVVVPRRQLRLPRCSPRSGEPHFSTGQVYRTRI